MKKLCLVSDIYIISLTTGVPIDVQYPLVVREMLHILDTGYILSHNYDPKHSLTTLRTLRLVAKYFESIGVYFVVIHISVELDLHVNHVKISEK